MRRTRVWASGAWHSQPAASVQTHISIRKHTFVGRACDQVSNNMQRLLSTVRSRTGAYIWSCPPKLVVVCELCSSESAVVKRMYGSLPVSISTIGDILSGYSVAMH